MKITIQDIPIGTEPEIIIKCNELDESMLQLIYSLKSSIKKLVGVNADQMHIIEPKDVFYFEAVDNKVFIYGKEKIYESKLKLYEIEETYESFGFFRASKSTVLNLEKIDSLKPAFGGRFQALLQNGEKVIISRQFVPILKKKLDL